MGSQKVPGLMVMHWNVRIYGNAYLITFKVGSLHEHTLAPSILPLLEGFFWNLLEFDHHVWYDVLHDHEMSPLEAYFPSREQPKVTRSEIGDSGGWVTTGVLFSARDCCITSDVWLSVLSWCRNHCLYHLSCCFFWTPSCNLCKTCMQK
jgi:hypothetical protein